MFKFMVISVASLSVGNRWW